MRGNQPRESKRIKHAGHAIAIRLVPGLTKIPSPGGDGLPVHRIAILDVYHDADGRAAVMLWAECIYFCILIGHHDATIPKLDFSVANRTVWRFVRMRSVTSNAFL